MAVPSFFFSFSYAVHRTSKYVVVAHRRASSCLFFLCVGGRVKTDTGRQEEIAGGSEGQGHRPLRHPQRSRQAGTTDPKFAAGGAAAQPHLRGEGQGEEGVI